MLRQLLSIALMSFIVAGYVGANADLVVYPSNGQTSEQQSQDEYQCFQWAKKQTGFDPTAPVTATTAPPPQEAPQGGILRGAMRGAVVGEIVSDDAGDGAAAGALIGGMRRRDQSRRQAANNQQWAQQESAQYSQQRDNYNRNYAACMEGRGYTVK